MHQLATSFPLIRPCVPCHCCSKTLELADGLVVHASKGLNGNWQEDKPLLSAGISGVPHFSVICLVKSPALAGSGSSKIGAGEGAGHGNVEGGVFPITPQKQTFTELAFSLNQIKIKTLDESLENWLHYLVVLIVEYIGSSFCPDAFICSLQKIVFSLSKRFEGCVGVFI